MAVPPPPTLVIKPDPGTSPRPKKLNLEHLPLEVVLRIYEFVLVERPRWDKTHTSSCRWKPALGSEIYENPPFLQTRVKIRNDDEGMTLSTYRSCTCATRRGLNLLLASRGVHQVAAPIFWANNTFCFLDLVDALAAIGHNLRPRYRELIRAISIMNPDKNGYPSHVIFDGSKSGRRHAFWDMIGQCRSLESLDIPAPYLTPTRHFDVARLGRLAAKLPSLAVLKINCLLTFCPSSMWDEYPPPGRRHRSPHVMFARSARTLAFREQEWAAEPVDKLVRGFQYNFRVYVSTAVKTTYLGASLENLENYAETFRLAPGIDEYDNRRRVTLPTGETAAVRFYGLPLGKRHRMDRARARQALDRKQKGANRLTHAQNEVVVAAKHNRRARREQEAAGNRSTHDREVAERRERLAELEAEADKVARKQQRKIARMDERRVVVQRAERKRVR